MNRTALFLSFLLLSLPAFAASSKSCHEGDTERGCASWYNEDTRTASGEKFDRHKFTAAHRSFPFGTVIRVTNRVSGRHVDVRINDRGPWRKDRILDVSEAVAIMLEMKKPGVIPVEIKVLKVGDGALKKKKHKGWWLW